MQFSVKVREKKTNSGLFTLDWIGNSGWRRVALKKRK